MSLQLLDPEDGEALERFERAFYGAFTRAKANRLVRSLWQWDDAARRIRPHIPYADQRVLFRNDEEGAVDTAAAINVRLASYQAARLGFDPPPASLSGHCEVLALFSRRDADLVGLRTFFQEVAEDLLAQGLRSADATCTDRLLPAYRHIGGQPLARQCLDGENRTLLRFQLAQVARLQSLT
jgi:hypothetical protein